MQNRKPHYGNLQARAHRLGLVVTKMTTQEDARAYGAHEYVLTSIGATQEQKDNARLTTLYGIRHEIEQIEAAQSAEVKDACGNVVKPSDPDYAEARASAFESSAVSAPVMSDPVRRAKAREVRSFLHDNARILGASHVVTPWEEARNCFNDEDYKDAIHEGMLHGMASHIRESVKFEEIPSQSCWTGVSAKEIRASVAVISVDDLDRLYELLRELCQ